MKGHILKWIDQNKASIVDTLLKLISFDTSNPPGDTREISRYIEDFFRDLGFRSRYVEPVSGKANLLVDNGVDGEAIFIYNGHMDVVPATSLDKWKCDPFEGCVSDGYVYGRGAADMKSSLAAAMYAVKSLIESGYEFKKRIELHFVADEEVGGRYGTKYLVEKGLVKGRYGLVGEASVKNGTIYIRPAVRGGVWIKIKSYGKAGHASNPSSGVNAVLNMARILDAIDREFNLSEYTHSILPSPTISPGTLIKGGVKENIIPDYCEAVCDIRIIPGISKDDVVNHIRGIIERLKERYPELSADVEVLESMDPAEIPLDSPILKVASDATSEVIGYKPRYLGGTGCNDSTYLINGAGVETISGFGPGDGVLGNAHGVNERVDINILIQFTKIYSLILLHIDML